jgi:hypothetical protein
MADNDGDDCGGDDCGGDDCGGDGGQWPTCRRVGGYRFETVFP